MIAKSFIQTTESRANNLDLLRFVLACVVIHSHSFMLSGHDYSGLRAKLLHLQLGGGGYAVDFFFMLSGFLIANSWLHSRGLFDYLKRRTLRIYPAFILCLALCVFVVGPLAGADLKTYYYAGETYTFFRPLILGPVGSLPGVFAHNPWPGDVNVPIWTIRFEFLCYLLLAALGALGMLRYRAVVVGIMLAALGIFAMQMHGRAEMDIVKVPLFGAIEQIPRFVAFFMAGTAFYLYRDRIPQSGYLALASLIALALAATLHAFQPGLVLFGTYLIFYVGFHPAIRFHNFARHGDFSYGMYLYGFPVQQLLVRHVPAASHPLVLTAMSIIGALALAFLSWRLVEKPFLKLKKTKSVRRDHREMIPVGSALADAV